jgi:hypothetical protein
MVNATGRVGFHMKRLGIIRTLAPQCETQSLPFKNDLNHQASFRGADVSTEKLPSHVQIHTGPVLFLGSMPR